MINSHTLSLVSPPFFCSHLFCSYLVPVMGLCPVCLCNVVLVSTHLMKVTSLSEVFTTAPSHRKTSLVSPARRLAAPLVVCMDLMSLHAQCGYLIRPGLASFSLCCFFSLEIRTYCACLCVSCCEASYVAACSPSCSLVLSSLQALEPYNVSAP